MVPPSSGSNSTLEEEEDRLLGMVELLFGDFDWDISDDPELLALLMSD